MGWFVSTWRHLGPMLQTWVWDSQLLAMLIIYSWEVYNYIPHWNWFIVWNPHKNTLYWILPEINVYIVRHWLEWKFYCFFFFLVVIKNWNCSCLVLSCISKKFLALLYFVCHHSMLLNAQCYDKNTSIAILLNAPTFLQLCP